MLARLVASDMQTRLNTEMVIENRGGGGGVIATEQVARAPRRRQDAAVRKLGSHVISAALRAGQLNYDAVKSFAPIAFVGAVPMLVIVSPDYPAKTLGRADRQGQDRQAELRLRRARDRRCTSSAS